jgi:hypothetical protein
VVEDRSAQIQYLYVDTVLMDSDSISAVDSVSNSEQFGIGAVVGGSFPFNGQIDDVRVYNYAINPTQIRTLYNENSALRFGPAAGSP